MIRGERRPKPQSSHSMLLSYLKPIFFYALTLYRYHGYNKALIDRFSAMGFDVPTVVSAFEFTGIDKNDGEDYELEEEYMGDITARLFNEA